MGRRGTPGGVGGPFRVQGQTASEREAIRGRWQEGMARVAENANVSVKLSGLTMPVCGFGYERREQEPTVEEVRDALKPLIDFVIEVFGVKRCMFASNFPVDKVSQSYAVLFDAFLAITEDRTPQERQQLFRDNAARFYGVESRAAANPH